MRGTTKLLLGAAFVFGMIGGAFCIAGFCLGYSESDFVQAVQAGGMRAARNLAGSDFSGTTGKDVEFAQSYSGIDELVLDVSGAECRLVPWEGKEWKVTGYQLAKDFKCRESEGTLKIKCRTGSRFLFWGPQQETACLELMFPQDVPLDMLEIDSGVGDILMEDGILACGEADVDCGIGNCTLRMDVGEELKIDCGVGDVSLLLAGAETDFDYRLDCGVGDITVDKSGESTGGEPHEEEHDADHQDLDDDGLHEEEHDAEHEADHQDLEDDVLHEEEHDAGYGTDYQNQNNSASQEVSGAKQQADHDAGREVRVSCGAGSVTLAFTEG